MAQAWRKPQKRESLYLQACYRWEKWRGLAQPGRGEGCARTLPKRLLKHPSVARAQSMLFTKILFSERAAAALEILARESGAGIFCPEIPVRCCCSVSRRPRLSPAKRGSSGSSLASTQRWRTGFFQTRMNGSWKKTLHLRDEEGQSSQARAVGARSVAVARLFAPFGLIPFRLQLPSCLIVLDVSRVPQERHPDPAAPDV